MEANFEGSFLDWLRQHSPGVLSLQEVAHFIRQAAKAIQDLHNHRIVHQNVTPSSFLVRGNSQAPNLPNLQLVDPEKARPSTAIAGTPTIMAPEQWRGVAVPATDQYAL